ncbi:MAG: DUF302 domain-containing protein [Candidatus Tectomicrobia bacterium]|nr:DUF302 domain-containing protein [Candidatus Tectomicrobia bacterium]
MRSYTLKSVLGAALLTILSMAIATSTHAQKMKQAPEFHTMVASQYGFDDTVSMLKGAMESENLMVINEIDPQKMLRMVGVKTKGIKQVFFFHPRFMKRLRDANMHATIEPPLKIAVMETPKGAVVKYIKPSYLLSRYEGVEDIGSELDAVVAKVVSSVQK